MRFPIRLASLLFVTILCGCGASESTAPLPSRPDLSSLIQQAPVSQPLSVSELKAFLLVMRELPRIETPLMADFGLPADELAAGVEAMRSRLRGTLQNDILAERWLSDPRVRRILREFQVEPQAFASLSLRVSATWSARIVSQGVRVSIIRRHVEQDLTRVLQELQSHSQVLSRLDQQELTESAANCVALSEFLMLLEQVPAESLELVARAEADLRQVLPRDAGVNAFVQKLDSQAQVLQAGWSAPR